MNTPMVTQVKGVRWPNGDSCALATLPLEADEVSGRLFVAFTLEQDDLGPYLASGIKAISGRLFLLVRYLEAPSPGVTIFVDVGDNLADALREILSLLHVRREDLSWVNENAVR